MHSRNISAVTVVSLGVMLSGCINICPEAGCRDALVVTVRREGGAIPDSFSGTAKFAAREIEFACPEQAISTSFECEGDGVVRLFQTGDVELTVGTTTRSLTPAYSSSKFISTSCSPSCRVAEETFILE